jgi:hypothetical protein
LNLLDDGKRPSIRTAQLQVAEGTVFDNSHKERIQMMRNRIEQLINNDDNNILGELDEESIAKFTHYKESFVGDKKDSSEIKGLIDWDDRDDDIGTVKTINIDFAITEDVATAVPERDENSDIHHNVPDSNINK